MPRRGRSPLLDVVADRLGVDLRVDAGRLDVGVAQVRGDAPEVLRLAVVARAGAVPQAVNAGRAVVDAGEGAHALEAPPGVVGGPRQDVGGVALATLGRQVVGVGRELGQRLAQAPRHAYGRGLAALAGAHTQRARRHVDVVPPQVGHLADAQAA